VEEPPRRYAGWVTLLVIFLIGGGVWFGLARLREQSTATKAAPVRTAAARVGDLEVLARVSGTSSARNYAVVVAPLLRSPDADRAMSLIMLAPGGKNVRKGDVIAEFDPTNIRDHIDDVKDMLENRRNIVKKLRVEHELQLVNLRQRLKVAQATGQKARLDMRTAEVRSQIQREQFSLAAEEADAVIKELQVQIELRKQAQGSALRIAQIAEKLEIDHVARHEDDERRLKIHAPIDGMVVVLARDSRHGERKAFEAGDLVTPGTPMLQVVDQKTLQIEATINQSEVTRFKLGQKATVGFDAYPERKFKGEVSAIGALATVNGRQQYFIRTIPIRVKLDHTDSEIIPDLSGYANVVLDRVDDALVIPEGAVEKVADGTFVEVKSGDTFVRRAVHLGPSDGVNVAVTDGLEAGDVVRLTQEK
jgi:multidrug efflux pump subunit AcrA (membrane-fusion protein)